MKRSTSDAAPVVRYALIGDLVASRSAESRAGAQRDLLAALDRVNRLVPHDQALEPTIGDEFQSVHGSLDEALRAAALVRCALPETMDARCGIGVGVIEIVGASAYGLTQDGPAWWSARTAVDEVKDRQRRLPALRTWVVDSGGEEGVVDLVNAYLLCRDEVLSALDARQRRIVLGLVEGRTHAEIARSEDVSPSAVSQRVRRGGIASLVESLRLVPTTLAGATA
ncbi:SatD family protein [Aeromicrobium sp. Leaf350]|uniref:SatD family protein n=1 Tax=Aeromicrobium sp. Leaf350 TaxID=2876565 RepID=UPI001E441E18|nr:SatD family protein [Aeromicrobium sp. Leaf350]